MDMKKDIENYIKDNHVNKGPIVGQRHVQAIIMFLCITIEMMGRSSLAVSIVAMTDNSTSTNPDIPTYNWTNSNIILSSFYWGYGLLQVFAGQLAKTYGAKWLLFSAMGFNSLSLALVPFAAKFGGSTAVMFCRFIQGMAQGGIFPCCHTMLGRWAPENERGRMSTFVYTGIPVGTIIASSLTGIISKSNLGWPASCYIFGGCGLAWCALWLCFGYNNPAVHPLISNKEKKYIEESLNQRDNEEVIPTPWKEMLTSIYFWACLLSTVGAGFGIIFIQNEMPTYLQKVMNYDIASTGFLTSLTAAVGVVFNFLFGPLADFIVEKNYVSQTNARKLFTVFACYGSAGTMLTLAYIDESKANLSVFIMTLSSVFSSALLFGHGVNPMDLSPRFGGIILAFCNGTASLFALLAPLAVQFIVLDETNAAQWRTVFIIAAVMYIFPSTFFAIFASAERQLWDDGATKMQDTVFDHKRKEEKDKTITARK